MRPFRAVLLAVAACALTGCFDLDQKVAFRRDGSGRYQLAISAEGPIGEALKSDKKKNDMLGKNKVTETTVIENGKVTKTARVDFKSLSELALNDETIRLKVLDHGFLGLTPSHMRLTRVFLVGHARDAHGGGAPKADDEAGRQIVASIFGGHTYSFSVTLPGSVDRVAPLRIGGVEVKPEIGGDFYHGHTIVWRMPLTAMMQADKLVFEVDFSALGSFADAETKQDTQHGS
jgi:hypothetical protein